LAKDSLYIFIETNITDANLLISIPTKLSLIPELTANGELVTLIQDAVYIRNVLPMEPNTSIGDQEIEGFISMKMAPNATSFTNQNPM
jgi:hypothetical protein